MDARPCQVDSVRFTHYITRMRCSYIRFADVARCVPTTYEELRINASHVKLSSNRISTEIGQNETRKNHHSDEIVRSKRSNKCTSNI